MENVDTQYKKLVREILNNGIEKGDRTGVGTKSIFGYQMKLNVEKDFPLLTLRKIHTKSLIHELLWFLESYDDKYKKFGNTNIKYLLDNGVTFWSEWPYEYYKNKILENYLKDDLKDDKNVKNLKILIQKEFENKIKNDNEFALKWGDLGPVYGKQWTDWGGYIHKVELKDEFQHTKSKSKIVNHNGWKEVRIKGINQIKEIIETLKNNPDSRRMIVSAWNVEDIDSMLLAPCHILFQFYSFSIPGEEKRRLSLQLYQRSADVGLGVPYNIASYTILLKIIANIVNMVPYNFVYNIGDAHIYNNHFEQINEVINRKNKNSPKINISNKEKITDYRFEDIKILDYNPHPNIKMQVAV